MHNFTDIADRAVVTFFHHDGFNGPMGGIAHGFDPVTRFEAVTGFDVSFTRRLGWEELADAHIVAKHELIEYFNKAMNHPYAGEDDVESLTLLVHRQLAGWYPHRSTRRRVPLQLGPTPIR